jgi:hypothetical protein
MKAFRRVSRRWRFGLVAFYVLTLLSPFLSSATTPLSSQAVQAVRNPAFVGGSWEWVDRSTIVFRVNGQDKYTLKDERLDYNHTYKGSDEDNCPLELHVTMDFGSAGITDRITSPGNAGANKAHLKYHFFSPNANQCQGENGADVSLGSADNFNKTFRWTDIDTIARSDAGLIFQRDVPLRTYQESGITYDVFHSSKEGTDTECPDFMLVPHSNNETRTGFYQEIDPDRDNDIQHTRHLSDSKFLQGSKCYVDLDGDKFRPKSGPINIYGYTTAISQQTPGAVSNKKADDSGHGCQIDGALGWILCPIIDTLNAFYQQLAHEVQSFLQTGVLDASSNSGAHEVWNNFRNLTNILFVIIFLVIIFSTTVSVGLDSYSVKKMLPRLVLAVIFVQFSWILMQLAFDVTNILGAGVSGLVNSVSCPGAGGPGQVGLTVGGIFDFIIVGGATGIAIALGLAVPLLLALLAAVIGILVVFIALVFRKFIIIVLVVLAPLAFVAWILPGTESYFKSWWKMLSRLLLMYPLIMLIFSMAGIFQCLTGSSSSTQSGGTLQNLVVAIFPILAFYTVPWTFKWAGGAMAAVGGFVSARAGRLSGAASKPLRDRGRELTSNRAANALAKRQAKAGELYAKGGFSALRARGMMAGAGSTRMADLARKAQSDQVKAERQKLVLESERGAADDPAGFKEDQMLLAKARSGSDYQKQAAIEMMVDRSHIGALNELTKDGNYDGQVAWQRAKSEKYSDISDKAGHLLESGTLDQKLDKFAGKISRAQIASSKKATLDELFRFAAANKTNVSPSADGSHTIDVNVNHLKTVATDALSQQRLMAPVREEERTVIEGISTI